MLYFLIIRDKVRVHLGMTVDKKVTVLHAPMLTVKNQI